MFDVADYIPISALQHYLYCPRQCALIHLEQCWVENVHTAAGRIEHAKVHSDSSEKRGPRKAVTGLQISSARLGISGIADMVDFHLEGDVWHPYPVEYKHGRPKHHDSDRVQLCAQAMCLEEMLGLTIPEGALFYWKPRRREIVAFDAALRKMTGDTVSAIRAMLAGGTTPPPPDARSIKRLCPDCSLQEACMPEKSGQSAKKYLEAIFTHNESSL